MPQNIHPKVSISHISLTVTTEYGGEKYLQSVVVRYYKYFCKLMPMNTRDSFVAAILHTPYDFQSIFGMNHEGFKVMELCSTVTCSVASLLSSNSRNNLLQ